MMIMSVFETVGLLKWAQTNRLNTELLDGLLSIKEFRCTPPFKAKLYTIDDEIVALYHEHNQS